MHVLCCRRDEAGTLYYALEFTVKSPSFFRHNLSVYAARRACIWPLACCCCCRTLVCLFRCIDTLLAFSYCLEMTTPFSLPLQE